MAYNKTRKQFVVILYSFVCPLLIVNQFYSYITLKKLVFFLMYFFVLSLPISLQLTNLSEESPFIIRKFLLPFLYYLFLLVSQFMFLILIFK